MPKNTFTAEQIAEILKRADETSASAAAREFGVSRMTIAGWRAEEIEKTLKAERKSKSSGRPGKKAKAAARSDEAVKKRGRKPKAAAAEGTADETVKKPGRKAKAVSAEGTADEAVKKRGRKPKAAASEETPDGTVKKRGRKPKAATLEETPDGTVKKRGRKAKTAEAGTAVSGTEAPRAAGRAERGRKNPEFILQSGSGQELTAEEIRKKVPDDTVKVYIRPDQNKLYFVKEDGSTESADLW